MCLHIGKSNPRKQYTMNGHLLESVDFEKDLGVIMDSERKFHFHTSSATKNKILGLIKKTFAYLDAAIALQVHGNTTWYHQVHGNTTWYHQVHGNTTWYHHMVPLYGAHIIWGSHFKLDQQAIEKVQRRATKLVGSVRNLTYKERLASLNLPSLLYRRRRGDMIMTFKIINGKLGIKENIYFKFNTAATRGHKQKSLNKKR